jgi:hypothetical protein
VVLRRQDRLFRGRDQQLCKFTEFKSIEPETPGPPIFPARRVNRASWKNPISSVAAVGQSFFGLNGHNRLQLLFQLKSKILSTDFKKVFRLDQTLLESAVVIFSMS